MSEKQPNVADATEFTIEIVKDALPNTSSTNDDLMPGDRNPADTNLPRGVTKVREYRGVTIERRNPHGMWFAVGLEQLGIFTSLEAAQEGITLHLEKSPG